MKGILSSIACAALLPWAAPASAEVTFNAVLIPGSAIQAGTWQVSGYVNAQTRHFDHCLMASRPAVGLELGVFLNGQNGWSVGIVAPAYSFTPRQTYQGMVYLGNDGPYKISATAISATGVVGGVGPDVAAKMKTGLEFAALFGGKRQGYNLFGVEAAAVQLKNCVQRYASFVATPAGPANKPAVGANPALKLEKTGTGFFIAGNTILTNNHVIDGCIEIGVRKGGALLGNARLLATTKTDDLAGLHFDNTAAPHLKFRVTPAVVAAESVLVFGYPLVPTLSMAGNTTLGYVTALAGERDDPRYIQISAAIQPGNSGGPALDRTGRVMGIVVSQIGSLKFAQSAGVVAQNINFAIKAATAVNFLKANHIAYETSDASAPLHNTDLAVMADEASVLLECRK